jgi:5-methylcytosine-specific restriction endonuclease McrA
MDLPDREQARPTIAYATVSIFATKSILWSILSERTQNGKTPFSIKCSYGRTRHDLVSLWINAQGCPPVRVKRVSTDAGALNRCIDTPNFSKDLNMVYRGEGESAFGESLRLALSKQRTCSAPEDKKLVLLKQDHRCKHCGDVMTCTEFDHTQCLADSGSNELCNIQPLCVPCQAVKSWLHSHQPGILK